MSYGKAIIGLSNTESEEVIVTAESSPELTSIPGTVNFGTIGEQGIRIIFWKEKKGNRTPLKRLFNDVLIHGNGIVKLLLNTRAYDI